jgi:hypothetical protein
LKEALLRRLVPELLAVAFFLGLAAVATRPLAAHLETHVVGAGDPIVDLWTIDWLTEHFFQSGQIFQGNIFHPAPHAVLYSDLSLGAVVLLLPFRHWLSDPVPLYNVAVLLTLAFAGWSFQALVHALTANRWAGLLAGVLAAFGSHQISHRPHINLLVIGWLALFLLGLHLVIRGTRLWGAALAGLSFSLSAQSSGYYGVSALVLGLVFTAFHWRALRDRRTLCALGAAGLLAVLLTLPYLRAYMEVRAQEGLRRPIGMSLSMSFQPERDLTSTGYLYGRVLGSGGERLFPGLLTLALAAVAFGRRRAETGFYAGATLVFLVLSLGPYLEMPGAKVPMPYLWLLKVPPFESMRHPYTFAAVATFLLSVLAGFGWSALRMGARPWAGAAVVLLAVAETLAPPLDLLPVPRGLPAYYATLDTVPAGPILELPVFAGDSLVWAARHGRPMLNGQGSAFVPIDTLRLDRFIQRHWLRDRPFDADQSKATAFLLARFPVRYVICPGSRIGSLARVATAFNESRTFALVAETSDGSRIYEVRRDAVPPPAAPVEDEADAADAPTAP